MAIDPNHKTLKRRSAELKSAARQCQDQDAVALLLFYAAECILKAHYLLNFSLTSTALSNAAAQSARAYGHRLDNILIALRVPPTNCPTRPPQTRLRNGEPVDVGQLHEAWRYGEKINNQADVLVWLNQVIAYSEARV